MRLSFELLINGPFYQYPASPLSWNTPLSHNPFLFWRTAFQISAPLIYLLPSQIQPGLGKAQYLRTVLKQEAPEPKDKILRSDL